MLNFTTGEPEWVLHQSFESILDFCIWVLEKDGLQVQPFTHHPDGNGELRAIGMTGDLWQAWLEKTVLLLDQRLKWHVENLNAEKQNRVAAFEKMALNLRADYSLSNLTSSDKLMLEEGIEKQLLWQEQHYQQAVSTLRKCYGSLPVPNIRTTRVLEIWDGNAAIGERLQELWSYYHRFVYHQRKENIPTLEEHADLNRVLWNALASYHERLPALELYFVSYPWKVEAVISPISAIISIAGEFTEHSAIMPRVLNIAEKLELLGNKPQNS